MHGERERSTLRAGWVEPRQEVGHRTARGLKRGENNSTCTDGGKVFLPLSLSFSTIQPLMQTNIYAKAQMPAELQGKQTEAVGTLLYLSLDSGEVEEEVVQLINNNNNRGRKQ